MNRQRTGRQDIVASDAVASFRRSRRLAHNGVRGYSLVEMIVSIVVVGVLISMGVPRFQQSLEQARANVAGANLQAIWSAQRLYWLENRTYATNLAMLQSVTTPNFSPLIDPSLCTAVTPYTYEVTSPDNGNTFTATADSYIALSRIFRLVWRMDHRPEWRDQRINLEGRPGCPHRTGIPMRQNRSIPAAGTGAPPQQQEPVGCGTVHSSTRRCAFTTAPRCRAHGGYVLFEVQMAFVVLGIGLAGLSPLVVMQLRQVRMLEMRLRGQVVETSRITGVSQAMVIMSGGVALPTPTYYIVKWKNPWEGRSWASSASCPDPCRRPRAI